MKDLFQSKPRYVFLFIITGAIVQVLDRAALQHSGDSMSLIQLIVISVIGSLIGAAFIVFVWCREFYNLYTSSG